MVDIFVNAVLFCKIYKYLDLTLKRTVYSSNGTCICLQAVADGDLEYVTALLHRAAELAGDTVPMAKFLKITNEEGYNMLHAAVCYKNVEIMELIFDYGTSELIV